MGEYNKLTKTLLSQGYTAEHYPKDIVGLLQGASAEVEIHWKTFMEASSTLHGMQILLHTEQVVECMFAAPM